MSEIPSGCQHELCYLKEPNPPSIHLYPCLYHCKKMLCIQHLSEHDQCIRNKIQYQNELKQLWNNYIKIFNEDQIREQLKILHTKLENHQKLNEYVNDLLSTDSLLSTNHLDESIAMNEKLQEAIEKVQDANEQEIQSKSMTYVCSEGTNNKEGDARQVAVIDEIHTINDYDVNTSVILNFTVNSSDEKGPAVTSESDWGSDNVFSPDVDKKHGEEILPSSKHLGTYNEWDQTSRVNEQPSITNSTTSPSDELSKTQNMSPVNQEIFQKPETTNSLEDMHNIKQSSVINFNSQSSEESCY
ncbi:unnamed protein product [Adineta steineri]|uniref:Uncharacterized protein n=1 Tax=Adineta steineri TaxID=433720 RepID=A0A819NK51_9BILA|nr:unnamed protein product [Adineta steineri]CAF3996020.1 unnamed protein product [Adineta steineri]